MNPQSTQPEVNTPPFISEPTPTHTTTLDFVERVRLNQQRLRSDLKSHYDFIVCGSGSSGSVVARRLAENCNVSVLLLEAGGDDDVPSVTDADKWPLNLGSERDWGFQAQPDPRLKCRTIQLSMGKVLGGGSSINVMVWARGHKNDWDFFASEAGDPAWSYESVLDIYRRIEDWHGVPDPRYRGTGGPVFVQPAPNPNPIAPAFLDGARSVGIPTFENQNGRMMEGMGGAAISDLRVSAGKRQSVFRSYTFPYMDRPNLTVLTQALVTRLIFNGQRVSGVEVAYDGKTQRIGAVLEVVLSLGAINTPKVLMQSGIGDASELQRFGIPVVQDLPGVGANFQDHPAVNCVWEYQEALPPHNNMGESTLFWASEAGLDTPDLHLMQIEAPASSPENAVRFGIPDSGWGFYGALVRPKSRGCLRLAGPNPQDPILIQTNFLSDPDDLKALISGVELCREIGNSAALRPFTRREVMPGNLKGAALEEYIREGLVTVWHETCTAKMGRDSMSVVDGNLKVHGVDGLRVADGSILPRVTTGNTQAPCVIIGERAAEVIRSEHWI